jgi:hypothetical protein
MIDIKFALTGVDGFKKTMDEMKKTTLVRTHRVMTILGQTAVNKIKKRAPRGVGKGGGLMGSYRYVVNANGLNYELIVGTNQEYAPDVEYGSEPHYVDPDDLFLWVKRKMQIQDDDEAKKIAYFISRKIRQYGTEPQPHLRPGLEEAVQIDLPMIIEKVKNVS